MNFFSKKTNPTNITNAKILNAKDFFLDYNENGYFSKEEFIAYLTPLRDRELRDFSGFIIELGKGGKFNTNMDVREDKAGNAYVFPHFFLTRGVKGFKLVYNSRIQRLIDDYSEGRINIGFTAFDLETVLNAA